MADSGRPVQIFNVYHGVPQFHLAELNKILSLVGDRPVAIISVNGGTRTGKSLLLNFFLNHDRMRADPTNVSSPGTLSCFAWRGGRERTTVGIWMWSVPCYLLDRSGREIGVLFMDARGSFDAQTDFRFNALNFCISIWLSSVFIYNTKSDLSEDKLQFLEYFTSFANNFDCEDSDSHKMFQKCVILIRDWQKAPDNQYGIHSRHRPSAAANNSEWIYEPAVDNYLQQMLVSTEGFSEEATETRHAVLNRFSDVSCCLFPYPGKRVVTCTTQGFDAEGMDEEFRGFVNQFVNFILRSDFLEPRKINETELTGHSLQPIVAKWAQLVYDERVPEAMQLKAASAEIQLHMLLHRVQKAFDSKLEVIRNFNPNRDRFLVAFSELAEQCLNSYKTRCIKFSAQEKKLNFILRLENYMEEQAQYCLAFISVSIEKDNLAEKAAEFQLERNEYYENKLVMEQYLQEQKVLLEKIIPEQNKSVEVELVRNKISKRERELEELKEKNDLLETNLARRDMDIKNQLHDYNLLIRLGRKEFMRIKGAVPIEHVALDTETERCQNGKSSCRPS